MLVLGAWEGQRGLEKIRDGEAGGEHCCAVEGSYKLREKRRNLRLQHEWGKREACCVVQGFGKVEIGLRGLCVLLVEDRFTERSTTGGVEEYSWQQDFVWIWKSCGAISKEIVPACDPREEYRLYAINSLSEDLPRELRLCI